MRPTTLLQLPTKKYANFATTPFVSPLSENSKFSTSQLFQPLLVCHRGLLSRYNSKWDRERRESLHILFWFGKLQSTLAILYSDHEFLDENQLLEKNDSTHGFRDGAVKLSWQEGPNSYVGRKRKLVTNYRNVTKLLRDESTLPWYYKPPAQTLLLIDDVERWLWKKGMK
jgi:hypothetical protein